jgi:hypothetical protein
MGGPTDWLTDAPQSAREAGCGTPELPRMCLAAQGNSQNSMGLYPLTRACEGRADMSELGQQTDPLAPPSGLWSDRSCGRRRGATYGVDVHTTPIETALTLGPH